MKDIADLQNVMKPDNARLTVADVTPDSCYGCGACQNICPYHAIEMKDILNEGFLYPVINQELCVNCGLCAKICPSLNRYNKNAEQPTVYVVKTQPEIADESSSAGVFYLLARYVFAQGGYICGAVYDDQFNVYHVLTNDWNTVLQMRKSKYVQSDMKNVYIETKEKLESGKHVLFTGTPCQVAGLYTFLGREYDSLLTMDIICHGVPSPGMWRKYLDENWKADKLENIDFRHKQTRKLNDSQHIKFYFKSGNEYIENKGWNYFYMSFQASMILRTSCENCQYAVAPKPADFSVGDWWGQAARPELIDDDQMSILLVNSKKAMMYLEAIKEDFKLLLEISMEQALTKNRSKMAIKISPKRNDFFELMRKGSSFQEAARKCLFPQYDAIIFGNTQSLNFGAILTYYALYKVLEKTGYNVALANKPLEEDVTNHSIVFYKKYTNLAPSEKQNEKYNLMTDIFLLGSDQLWNYPLFKNLGYYLNFANPDKKKITYATSFGFDYLTMLDKTQSIYPDVNSLMKRFDAISVREEDGINICDREHSVDATWVLDCRAAN